MSYQFADIASLDAVTEQLTQRAEALRAAIAENREKISNLRSLVARDVAELADVDRMIRARTKRKRRNPASTS